MKIKYVYMNNIYESNNLNKKSKIIDIILNYLKLLNQEFEDFQFLIDGKRLKNNEIKIKEFNKKIITILIIKISKNKNELNHIVCPKCENLTLINIKDNQIILDKCKNKDETIFYNAKDLIDNQKKIELKIK